MADQGFTFDRDAVKRIDSAVRRVEQGRPRRVPQRRRFVSVSPRGAVLVRITGTEDGGGKYGGVLLNPPSAPTDSNATVSQADLGDVGIDIYIINAAERDQNTHDLSLVEGDRPKDFLAVYRYPDPTDGKPTYAIESMQFRTCEGGDSGGSSYSPSMSF